MPQKVPLRSLVCQGPAGGRGSPNDPNARAAQSRGRCKSIIRPATLLLAKGFKGTPYRASGWRVGPTKPRASDGGGGSAQGDRSLQNKGLSGGREEGAAGERGREKEGGRERMGVRPSQALQGGGEGREGDGEPTEPRVSAKPNGFRGVPNRDGGTSGVPRQTTGFRGARVCQTKGFDWVPYAAASNAGAAVLGGGGASSGHHQSKLEIISGSPMFLCLKCRPSRGPTFWKLTANNYTASSRTQLLHHAGTE